MKKITILLLMLATFATTFNSCKKGEDDPFLSLRSRDGRLMREWVLEKYEISGKSTDNSANAGNARNLTEEVSSTYSGGQVTITRKETEQFVPGNTFTRTVNFVYDYSETLKFDKNGKVMNTTSTKNINRSQNSSPSDNCGGFGPVPSGNYLTCDGTYNYASNVSDDGVTTNWSWLNTNQNKEYISAGGRIFYVKRLTSKELVLVTTNINSNSNTFSGGSNSESGDFTETYTYKAK